MSYAIWIHITSSEAWANTLGEEVYVSISLWMKNHSWINKAAGIFSQGLHYFHSLSLSDVLMLSWERSHGSKIGLVYDWARSEHIHGLNTRAQSSSILVYVPQQDDLIKDQMTPVWHTVVKIESWIFQTFNDFRLCLVCEKMQNNCPFGPGEPLFHYVTWRTNYLRVATISSILHTFFGSFYNLLHACFQLDLPTDHILQSNNIFQSSAL